MVMEHTADAAGTAQTRSATTPEFASLWKRVSAHFLDWVLLAVIGMGIGYFFFDALAAMGLWGVTVGFVVAMVYFGICDSGIRNGQSFGKLAMKIRVVSRSGAPLNVQQACVRAAILLLPYFMVGIPFDMTARFWTSILLSVLIFGTAFGLAYLLLCNRATRQSLHDLAVGAYVVKAEGKATGAPTARRLPRGHAMAVVALFVLAAVLPVLGAQLTMKEPFVSLLALQNLLSAEPGVARVNVTDGTKAALTTKEDAKQNPKEGAKQDTKQDTTAIKTLSIQVALQSKALFDDAFADKIARLALENHAAASGKDAIAVTLSYGYDIGIATAQTTRVYTFSPAEWRRRLGMNPIDNPNPSSSSIPN